MLGRDGQPCLVEEPLKRGNLREAQANSFYFPLQARGRGPEAPARITPYLAQGEGLWAVPVEGLFERAQPSLSNANLVPQSGLLINGGVGFPILVDVSHPRAGEDFNGATTEPDLSEKEKNKHLNTIPSSREVKDPGAGKMHKESGVRNGKENSSPWGATEFLGLGVLGWGEKGWEERVQLSWDRASGVRAPHPHSNLNMSFP